MKILIILLLFNHFLYSQNKKTEAAHLFFLEEITKQKEVENDSTLESTKSSNFFMFFIFYKKCISRHDMPNLCKFEPSCGSYGALALKNHGIIKGTIKTFDRLQRCNGKHYDNQYLYLPNQNKYLDLP